MFSAAHELEIGGAFLEAHQTVTSVSKSLDVTPSAEPKALVLPHVWTRGRSEVKCMFEGDDEGRVDFMIRKTLLIY